MVESIKAQIAELEDERNQIQGDQKESAGKLEAEQQHLAELMEQARRGNIENAEALTKALQTVAGMEKTHKALESKTTNRLGAIAAKVSKLTEKLHKAKIEQGRAKYYAGLCVYAQSMLPLLDQAEELRRTARKVGISVEPEHIPSALLSEETAVVGGIHIRELARKSL